MFRDKMEKIRGMNAPHKLWDSYQYEIGFSQWEGTRASQNDVIGVAGPDPQKGILLSLADGIGTGEIAGRTAGAAVLAIQAVYEQNRPEQELQAQVLQMIGAAHKRVMALKRDQQQPNEVVGAAVACLLARKGRACVATVGNVRVFLARSGRLLQLNRDHLQSLEAEQRGILAGMPLKLDPKMALSVTAYIGKEGLSELDFLEGDLRLLPEDRLILMSSGLYGVLTDEEIVQLVSSGQAQKAADSVIDQVWARTRDSQSNVSIAILKIGIR